MRATRHPGPGDGLARPARPIRPAHPTRPARWAALLPMVVMTAAAGYFLLPLWWLLVSATKSRGDLSVTDALWFGEVQLLTNCSDLLAREDGLYLRWLANTVLYAVAGALLATLLSALAGFAFAKYRFRGREAAFAAVLAGVLVPPAALALPLFLLFSWAGLTNTYWSVLIPSLVSPLGVYLARLSAEAIPEELLESARLDGASEYRMVRSVVLRLMRPALGTIFLFQLVAIWNNFSLPLLMLTDDELYPVTLGLYSWNTQVFNDPDLTRLVIVGSGVSVLPLLVAFLGLERYWRSGFLTGAIKG